MSTTHELTKDIIVQALKDLLNPNKEIKKTAVDFLSGDMIKRWCVASETTIDEIWNDIDWANLF